MTLRMEQLLPQLPGVVAAYAAGLESMKDGLKAADSVLSLWSADRLDCDARIRAAMAGSSQPYAVSLREPPGDVMPLPPFAAVTVVSSDGSSIEPDRFAPVQCYVVNAGFAVLPYGTGQEAALGARCIVGPPAPEAEGEEDEGAEDTGPRAWGVNLLRDVVEMETGSGLAVASAAASPTVLLLDGTLLPWDLDSRQVAESTRQELVGRTREALDHLSVCGGSLSVGAYVSGSRSSDVVNSLRALAAAGSRGWPASDGHLFATRLRDGERSAVFRAASERVRRVEEFFEGQHEVCFFYLRIGDDVARVELPRWATTPGQVERLHATLVDQCRRCDGYPRALQEAHEQAVISAGDRQAFSRMLDAEALRHGLRASANSKQMSKRRRGL